MSQPKLLMVKLADRPLLMLIVLGLFCARLGGAQQETQSEGVDAAVFGSEVNALLAAQQEALSSGDADQILKTSSSVAVASLAMLDNLDAKDQESRKGPEALSYAEGLLSDLPTELSLLKLELSLKEGARADELKKHIESANADSAELHLELSKAFAQGSALDEAAEEAQRAAALDPTRSDAEIALGMAYWRLNAFAYNPETLSAFTAAHELDPTGYQTNMLLASIDSQYQRYDDAAPLLHAAAAASEDAPEPWYQLGMNAYEQGRLGDAHELLEKYLTLYDASGKENPAEKRLALLTLDQIAMEQGETPDGSHGAEEEALKKQLLAGRDEKDAVTPGMGMQGPGMPALRAAGAGEQPAVADKAGEGKADSATLAQLRELAANALGNIGTVLARKQDYAGAVAPFKYAAAEDPSLEPVIRNLGLAACVSGMYEAGEQALKQVVAAHAEDGTARACLGMAEFETGEYAEAAVNFGPLGDALAKQPLFYATAAAVFARTGDGERAKRALAGLDASAQNAQLEAREAIAYLDVGNAERARTLSEAAIGADSQNAAEAHRVLGLLALERGDGAKAVNEFESESKAEQEGTESQIESQALTAEALIESGKAAEGESLGVKLGRTNPDLGQKLFEQGETLMKNGDGQAGYEKLAAAVALAPHDKEFQAAYDAARRALRTPAP